MIDVHIPFELRDLAGGAAHLTLEAKTVVELFSTIDSLYPELCIQLRDMAIAIDGDIINEPMLEKLTPDGEVFFMQRISGG